MLGRKGKCGQGQSRLGAESAGLLLVYYTEMQKPKFLNL
jgi:hypothetical protein